MDLFKNIGISSFLAKYSCSVQLYDIHARNLFFPFQRKRKFAVSLCLVTCCLSFLPASKSEAIDITYCNSLGPQIQGFCPAFLPTPYCCASIFTVMGSSCICHVPDRDAVKMFWFDMDELVDLYYNCNGKQPKDGFSKLCKSRCSLILPPSLPPSPPLSLSFHQFYSLFHYFILITCLAMI